MMFLLARTERALTNEAKYEQYNNRCIWVNTYKCSSYYLQILQLFYKFEIISIVFKMFHFTSKIDRD